MVKPEKLQPVKDAAPPLKMLMAPPFWKLMQQGQTVSG